MEKHYVLDIKQGGKAFGRLQMFTPWAADQGYQLSISQVKERRIIYQSGIGGITILGDTLELEPYPHSQEVPQQ